MRLLAVCLGLIITVVAGFPANTASHLEEVRRKTYLLAYEHETNNTVKRLQLRVEASEFERPQGDTVVPTLRSAIEAPQTSGNGSSLEEIRRKTYSLESKSEQEDSLERTRLRIESSEFVRAPHRNLSESLSAESITTPDVTTTVSVENGTIAATTRAPPDPLKLTYDDYNYPSLNPR